MTSAMPPFSRMLVPYDGSEPARAALAAAIALATHGVGLVIASVVDETPLIADASGTMAAYDPTPIMDELDAQGRALLDEAVKQCYEGGVDAAKHLVHDKPVPGILAAGDTYGCDLIVMGTHARSGVARTFLGSTTEGVLRLSRIPVLTVRTVDHVAAAPFAQLIVAVDDSEPSDAAAAVAARLARGAGASVTAVYAVDTLHLYENAANYGFDPDPLAHDMREAGRTILQTALAHAGLPAQTPVAVVDGEPAAAIVDAAKDRGATMIVTGTHGRRGVRRFLLGSVAEHLVRTSEIPVLVVPVP
jgi:nucleotide-binding universal stress UspA family protein